MMSYEGVKIAARHAAVPIGPQWPIGPVVLHDMYNADLGAYRTISAIFNSITSHISTHDIFVVEEMVRKYASSGDFTCVPMGATPTYAMTAELRAAIDLEIEISQTNVLSVVANPVVIFGMKYSYREAEKINTSIKNYLSLYDEGMITTRPAGLKLGKFFIDVERLKTLTFQLDQYLK